MNYIKRNILATFLILPTLVLGMTDDDFSITGKATTKGFGSVPAVAHILLEKECGTLLVYRDKALFASKGKVITFKGKHNINTVNPTNNVECAGQKLQNFLRIISYGNENCDESFKLEYQRIDDREFRDGFYTMIDLESYWCGLHTIVTGFSKVKFRQNDFKILATIAGMLKENK